MWWVAGEDVGRSQEGERRGHVFHGAPGHVAVRLSIAAVGIPRKHC